MALRNVPRGWQLNRDPLGGGWNHIVIDAVIAILSGWVILSGIAFAFENFTLYLWCRHQGAPVSYARSSIPGATLRTYFKWCREQGVPPDQERVRRHRLVRSNFVASLVGIGAILVITTIRDHLRGGP